MRFSISLIAILMLMAAITIQTNLAVSLRRLSAALQAAGQTSDPHTLPASQPSEEEQARRKERTKVLRRARYLAMTPKQRDAKRTKDREREREKAKVRTAEERAKLNEKSRAYRERVMTKEQRQRNWKKYKEKMTDEQRKRRREGDQKRYEARMAMDPKWNKKEYLRRRKALQQQAQEKPLLPDLNHSPPPSNE